jgi:ferritin
MLDKKVAELLNDQVSKELYSSYLYLDFANYFHEIGLDGFANWYDIQAKEELDHAMLMRTYLHNNSEKVKFETIDQPSAKIDAPMDALKEALKHEHYVTTLINGIYRAANDANDFRTMQFLDWFVKEQGEEEKNSEDLIRKYELFGSDPKGLYSLNQELLSRVYTAPSLVL